MNYQYNDGGRAAAGFKGQAADCVCRALSICTGQEYKTIYKIIAEHNKEFGMSKSARNGVIRPVRDLVLKQFGFTWVAAPKFHGRKARCSDLPKGTYIAKQAGHVVCVIDGVPQDIFDSSQKMVYGYWKRSI